MSLRHALLGYLSLRPLAGYDLKKLVSESVFLPWSGNNNQIYTSLVALHREGLVSLQVVGQESLPPRKVYSLTAEGRSELLRWLRTPPEATEPRNVFLVQLAWADALSHGEIVGLAAAYEAEVRDQAALSREQARRAAGAVGRTPREVWLWKMIYENRVRAWEAELAWARDLRSGLAALPEQPAAGEAGSPENLRSGLAVSAEQLAAGPATSIENEP
jgi:PadR family transcriptional regulator, regulatory protein AphA